MSERVETLIGSMPVDWEAVEFGFVAELKHGHQFRTPDFTDEGVKVLKITQIKSNGLIDISSCDFISEKRIDEFRKFILKKGDVLMALTGATIGKTARYNKDEVALQNYRVGNFFSRDESILSRDYLYSFLTSKYFFNQILARQTQSAQQNIGKDEINKMLIFLPNISEQKAIAHVLGTLDDRIELNRQMNDTLEAMAQALFKSWFVDFDPVIDNALANGKEIPEELGERAQARSALGHRRRPLPEEIRALFPDEFVYSEELGWTPMGWEVKSIDEALEVNPPVRLKKGKVAKFVDMKALPTSGFSVVDVIRKPYSGGAKFENGDVLLARITPCLENGKTGVVDFLVDNEVGFGSTEFIVLRGKGELSTPFVACLARYHNFRDHCIQSMVGSSGRQRVQNACLTSFYLALPIGNGLLDMFNDLSKRTFQKFTQQREQSKVLSKLRDTLLPKLLSGELRIPDAEKLIESVDG